MGSNTFAQYVPQLPNELCRDIIANLDSFNDKGTLRCLALVSKAWCAESQRVLFRTVCVDSMDMDKRDSLIYTHILFLEAILLDPTRLGAYVQTYQQHGLICHPLSKVPFPRATPYLWDLTAKVLPRFINLKHLMIIPRFDDPMNPRAPFLEGCTFQLETLRWGFEVLAPEHTDTFLKFLRTQQDLLHLSIGVLPQKQDLSWLPDEVCPRLISVSCRLDCAAQVVSKRADIVGLTSWRRRGPQAHLSGLHCLKYLSISIHTPLLSSWKPTESRLTLLELTSWHVKAVPNLSGLSKLRILAVLHAPRQSVPSQNIGYDVDLEQEYDLHMDLGVESFHRCPSLEYVVMEDIYRGQGPRSYKKVSLTVRHGAPKTRKDLQSEKFIFKYEPGMPWWTAYDV